MEKQNPHISVLLNESITNLRIEPGNVVIDCTVGAGGHLLQLAEHVGSHGLVIGIDRDESALAIAEEQLKNKNLKDRVELVHAPFSSLFKILENRKLVGKVNGILADIGVSSMHLDDSERGFSFQKDGPLDMRMDNNNVLSASNIINHSSEEELINIFRNYGEEPKAKIIARKIIEKRESSPFSTTKQLADFIKSTIYYPSHSRKHPATRIFQALRIAVNDELGELRKLLETGFNVLASNGRLAIITFHSLEDRMVKDFFLELSGKNKLRNIPRHIPINAEDLERLSASKAYILKPFPIVPSLEEIARNPRARSAKLRIAIKKSFMT